MSCTNRLECGISPRQKITIVYITDANKIIKLSRDFEEAKAIVDYNWHGFDDVEIIQK